MFYNKHEEQYRIYKNYILISILKMILCQSEFFKRKLTILLILCMHKNIDKFLKIILK